MILEEEDSIKLEQDTKGRVRIAKGSVIEIPRLEKKRWLVLMSFCTLTFANASSFVTYSPILAQT